MFSLSSTDQSDVRGKRTLPRPQVPALLNFIAINGFMIQLLKSTKLEMKTQQKDKDIKELKTKVCN